MKGTYFMSIHSSQLARFLALTLILGGAAACQTASHKKGPERREAAPAPSLIPVQDVHSYANPGEVRVRHVDLDLTVNFERKVLQGVAILGLTRVASGQVPLKLDSRDLKIKSVEAASDEGELFKKVSFKMGKSDRFLGSPLTVSLPQNADRVRITYETSPKASGLQWLKPIQTAGKKQPYLFSQSESIHARSWIPLQDSPQARVTYSAVIHTPRELRAVMSAEQDGTAPKTGEYRFRMPQAVPPYLIALAVGDLEFRALSARTGVYTEPSMMEKVAYEMADTEKMVQATERLYGPYRWGRYDILVLPPSFPIGGMENPRLTFATPTMIAGDRSLVSLIAHELAHSWSGNLVTNATWSDFWLNEGFTTYLERRVTEELYGRGREEMEAALAKQELLKEMKELPEADRILHVGLKNRDPDDGFTRVPYEKGYLFLRSLEETFGRSRFDRFLRGYFERFAFQSISTADFEAYLRAHLLDGSPELAAKIPVQEWLYAAGLPSVAPEPVSNAFAEVEKQAKGWLEGAAPVSSIKTQAWTTQEWLHFLQFLPKQMTETQLKDLDQAFHLTEAGNAEIAHQWLLIAIRNRYAPANARLEEYMISIGRQKLIRPLYEELIKTTDGRKKAERIFAKASPGYHPITVTAVKKALSKKS